MKVFDMQLQIFEVSGEDHSFFLQNYWTSMKPESNYFLLLTSLCLILTFCLGGCRDKSKNIPDVSEIEVPLNIVRFDQALFSLDTNNMEAELEDLTQSYPDFSQVYFGNLLGAYDKRLA
ncbi:MAG: hypothetical protein AAF551_13400, partial [Bacteroidota bacterium]